jgi:hypothetical protein
MHSYAAQKLKLSPHQHTGKKLPHHHTSYGVLLLLLLVTGYLFINYSRVAVAGPVSSSGSVNLSGIMPGPPPSSPAVIEKPTAAQRFADQHIQVSGTCPDETVVQIVRNGIFAGSVNCGGGKFQLSIDLLAGSNTLLARVVDNLGQAGPDSATVEVFYDPPTTLPAPTPGPTSPTLQPPTPSALAPLLLTSDSYYRGVLVNQDMRLDLTITGGQNPYAVEIIWGDGERTLLARADSGQFLTSHSYPHGGIYNIVINLKDKNGESFYLQLAALVNGTAVPVASTTKPASPGIVGGNRFLWPAYLIITGFILAFWLGERFEVYWLKRQHRLTV